jgi:hypothetical protein
VKNVQVIDGALNCTYSIYARSDRTFTQLFPEGADVEFAEDVHARLGATRARTLLKALWRNPLDKKTATGIQGTLFHGLPDRKRFLPDQAGVGGPHRRRSPGGPPPPQAAPLAEGLGKGLDEAVVTGGGVVEDVLSNGSEAEGLAECGHAVLGPLSEVDVLQARELHGERVAGDLLQEERNDGLVEPVGT